ncbi:MAG: SapC family protein [Betaproteobacteria bacterium]|nr:SapC family protein [Betaproteobacteria bacterium]
MNITPPFAYSSIVPLYKAHRVVFPQPGKVPAFCRAVNVLPLSFSEFARASHDFPIAFVSGDGGKSFAAMAVLGLNPGENLFVDGEGGWERSVYIPAYARRYPFCMAKVTVDDRPRDERVVCVEQKAVSAESGEALYDDEGQPLPRWAAIEKFLRDYEADLLRTEEMCSTLRDFGLLAPFTMQAVPNQGAAIQLSGMHRVEEPKLESLTADQLRTLIRKGIMGRIYLHLASLDNFARLLERNVTRGSAPFPHPAATEPASASRLARAPEKS